MQQISGGPEQAAVDEAQAREYLKQAVADLLTRKPEVLSEIVEEVLEDLAFGRMIEESLTGERVSREEIFQILNGEKENS